MARLFDDGSFEYLARNVPGTDVINPPFTMSCFFNCDDGANVGTLMCIANTDRNHSHARLVIIGSASPKELWANYVGNDSTQSSAKTNTWSADTWHHAAGVFPSTSSRIVYLDGANKVTESTAETGLSDVDSWAVGLLTRLNKLQYISGLVAEAGWWDAALIDPEIALLAKGYSPLLVRPQNLRHYLPLIRDDDNDLIKGVKMVAYSSPEIAPHPRVFYIAPPVISHLGSAAPTPPDAPTNLTAIAFDSDRIDLAWIDNADDEDGFKIERSPDGSDWTQIDTAAADAESYNDTGLDPNTLYYYRVRAYNGAGNSAYTNTASATTPPDDVTLQQYLVWDGSQIKQTDYRYTALVDGVPEPDTVAGVCWIYVDEDDGDLKAKFGDGTVKTITVDT